MNLLLIIALLNREKLYRVVCISSLILVCVCGAASAQETDKAVELLKLALDCRSAPQRGSKEFDNRQSIYLNEYLGDKRLFHHRVTALSTNHDTRANTAYQVSSLTITKADFSEIDPGSIELYRGDQLMLRCTADKNCFESQAGTITCKGTRSKCPPPTNLEKPERYEVASIYICSKPSFQRAKLALEVLIDAARSNGTKK